MEQRIKFREALGLTQEEAAQFLKIPKSLLGMFEIGQRDLSSPVKLQLVTLYNLVEKQESKASNSDKKEKYFQELTLELKKELLEMQYKQQVLARKLALFQSKSQKSEKLLQFVHVLETEVKKEERPSQDYIEVLKIKAEKEVAKYGTLAQIKLELKLRSIKSYQKEIKVEVKKYQK
jgi:transcriptional regulator with XRE-family HTH domain